MFIVISCLLIGAVFGMWWMDRINSDDYNALKKENEQLKYQLTQSKLS
jgi:hypothetical protein